MFYDTHSGLVQQQKSLEATGLHRLLVVRSFMGGLGHGLGNHCEHDDFFKVSGTPIRYYFECPNVLEARGSILVYIQTSRECWIGIQFIYRPGSIPSNQRVLQASRP